MSINMFKQFSWRYRERFFRSLTLAFARSSHWYSPRFNNVSNQSYQCDLPIAGFQYALRAYASSLDLQASWSAIQDERWTLGNTSRPCPLSSAALLPSPSMPSMHHARMNKNLRRRGTRVHQHCGFFWWTKSQSCRLEQFLLYVDSA